MGVGRRGRGHLSIRVSESAFLCPSCRSQWEVEDPGTPGGLCQGQEVSGTSAWATRRPVATMPVAMLSLELSVREHGALGPAEKGKKCVGVGRTGTWHPAGARVFPVQLSDASVCVTTARSGIWWRGEGGGGLWVDVISSFGSRVDSVWACVYGSVAGALLLLSR